MNVTYLTPEELIEIHKLLIEEFGGSEGLRDRGLLESACYRPRSGYYETLFTQAAALLHSLAMNHVFVDGNKRLAWVATKTFLWVNGYHLKASADDAELFVLDLIVGRGAVESIAAWLADRVTAR